MPTIKQFEDLEVWRAARALTKAIYPVSSTGQFAGVSNSQIRFVAQRTQ